MDHQARVGRLRRELDRPLLVTNLTNIRYLTGFAGSSAYFLVGEDRCVFLTDGRYGEVAGHLVGELADTDLVVYSAGLPERLAEAMEGQPSVGLEAESVTWDFVRTLGDRTGAELVPTTGVVEALRRVKDQDEVDALRRAAAAGDAAFGRLAALLEGAATEGRLGDRLIDAMKSEGAERAAWEPIVAVDANAARPHHRSGTGALGDGVLLMDYGCVVEGYHSDMTRTVVVGDAADPDVERVYRAVLEANEEGIAASTAGAVAGDIDARCRSVLEKYGYADHFVHSTGHGVGLDIHEGPWVKKNSTDVLEPGHVITIEPGVYLPGRFGVRIEDMVLITSDGPEVLTNSTKEMQLR